MHITAPLPAQDANERALLARVRPPDWVNPKPRALYDLAILGAGPAGLAAAEMAVSTGLSVALIERNVIGGNSLDVGSIPSKAMISSAARVAAFRDTYRFGVVKPAPPPVDFGAVMARMKRLRARIAGYHSAARLRDLGVDVFFSNAQFAGSHSLEINSGQISFKKALVATGARPKASDIPGFEQLNYFTSSTIFDITALPERLAIVGGGPLGCELAQAFCRLGSHVIIIQNEPKFLPNEERDAAELLSWALSRDGVEVRLNTSVTAGQMSNGIKTLVTLNNGIRDQVQANEILLSVGRVPNVEDLNLSKAGVDCLPSTGIEVDAFLCTRNPDIYAAGDVCSTHKFANVAEASGRLAVTNAFFSRDRQQSSQNIPWCTFCAPEIARIGLDVASARQQSIPVRSYTVMMQDVDRAITDGMEDGFVKICVRDGTDEILGATIVAARASEMINEMSVIMSAGVGMRALAEILHTYPTQSDAIRMAARAFVQAERSATIHHRLTPQDAA